MADGDNILDLKVYSNSKKDSEEPQGDDSNTLVAFLREQADELEKMRAEGPVKAMTIICRDNEETHSFLFATYGDPSEFEAVGMIEVAKTLLLNGDV